MLTRPLDPRVVRSLRSGVRDVAPGALCVLTSAAGLVLDPQEGARLRFGRNRPEVDVCVGENDLNISRVHGLLHRQDGWWWISATGRTPIRLATSVLVLRDSDPIPLEPGYTPLFLRGGRNRTHVLELYVAGEEGGILPPRPDAVTEAPQQWWLTERERLALTALGQRFLLYDRNPHPLTRQQAADQLAEQQPEQEWTTKSVEHLVAGVRNRLAGSGVAGLRREEVGEPIGLTLTINLLRELVFSGSLVPRDLSLLDEPDDSGPGQAGSRPATTAASDWAVAQIFAVSPRCASSV